MRIFAAEIRKQFELSHNMKYLHYIIFTVAVIASCCKDRYHTQLLLAEEQVTRSADSCSRLLEGIPVEELNSEDEALYGLVNSWLLYRQYAKEIPEEPLNKAFDYFHESTNPLRRAQVYFLRSVISQDQKRGQASQWMEDLYTACLAIEQTDDYLLASQIYQNYSSKLWSLKQFDEARLWVDKFVEAARKSGHRGEYVQALIQKSSNCLYLEETRVKREFNIEDGKEVASHTQFEEAFTTIYAALDIAQRYDMEVEKGRIYNQLAIYHSRCQRLDSLLHYARLSTSLNERLYAQGKRKELTHYITLADAHRKLGNADSAIYYARKTFDTPEMPLRNKRVAAQLIYNTYADLLGDYQTSLEWMRVFILLNDSINQTTIASNIEVVQDVAVKEQEKAALQEEQQHTRKWLLWSVIIGVVIIIGISFRMFLNRRTYHRHLQEMEDDFNHRISDMRASETVQTPDVPPLNVIPDEKVVLTGTTREQVEVLASSILFLTSESNYVKVLYLDTDNKVKSKMLRQTMSNIESQLNLYPHIIRCHRAFIVNMQHVMHASSLPSGLQLTLDATTLAVPVSKTYISLVKESIK